MINGLKASTSTDTNSIVNAEFRTRDDDVITLELEPNYNSAEEEEDFLLDIDDRVRSASISPHSPHSPRPDSPRAAAVSLQIDNSIAPERSKQSLSAAPVEATHIASSSCTSVINYGAASPEAVVAASSLVPVPEARESVVSQQVEVTLANPEPPKKRGIWSWFKNLWQSIWSWLRRRKDNRASEASAEESSAASSRSADAARGNSPEDREPESLGERERFLPKRGLPLSQGGERSLLPPAAQGMRNLGGLLPGKKNADGAPKGASTEKPKWAFQGVGRLLQKRDPSERPRSTETVAKKSKPEKVNLLDKGLKGSFISQEIANRAQAVAPPAKPRDTGNLSAAEVKTLRLCEQEVQLWKQRSRQEDTTSDHTFSFSAAKSTSSAGAVAFDYQNLGAAKLADLEFFLKSLGEISGVKNSAGRSSALAKKVGAMLQVIEGGDVQRRNWCFQIISDYLQPISVLQNGALRENVNGYEPTRNTLVLKFNAVMIAIQIWQWEERLLKGQGELVQRLRVPNTGTGLQDKAEIDIRAFLRNLKSYILLEDESRSFCQQHVELDKGTLILALHLKNARLNPLLAYEALSLPPEFSKYVKLEEIAKLRMASQEQARIWLDNNLGEDETKLLSLLAELEHQFQARV